MNIRQAYRQIRALKWISPGSFVLCAATFAGVYAVLHVLGFRQYTAILCGTLPAARSAQVLVGFGGVMYTFFHMLSVLVAPILLIAAVLLWGTQRRLARRSPDQDATE